MKYTYLLILTMVLVVMRVIFKDTIASCYRVLSQFEHVDLQHSEFSPLSEMKDMNFRKEILYKNTLMKYLGKCKKSSEISST